MSSYLIIFLLFLLQFIYLPIGTSYFEGSKIYVFETVIFILCFFWLFSKQKLVLSLPKYKKSFLISIGIIFFISCFHFMFSSSPTILFGNQFRLQGTVLLWFLMLFSLVSGNFAIEKKIKKIFILGIIFVQFVCTVLFIGVGADRPIGTLGEPNALAAAMLFFWPFLFFPRPQKRHEWIIAFAGLLLVLLIIFVTGSRSGVIAVGIQGSFLLLYYIFKKSLGISLLVAFILLLLSFITPFLSKGNLYENRGEVWVASLYAASSSPVIGVGFGNAEYALHSASNALNNYLQGYYVDSSHNIFLDWLLQGGVIGLSLLILVMYDTMKSFLQKQNVLYLVLFLGLISPLSFNPASVVSLVALWWLIGRGNYLVNNRD